MAASSTQISKARAVQIPALTGIRAIAAYLVFFHHYPIPQLVYGEMDFFREFHIGVTLFYVLSGFLITYRYRDALQLNGKWLKTDLRASTLCISSWLF
jgi:peptidoglycan/LPS O-acetylase OafA/YrhL